MCRLFGLHAGTDAVTATFWLLNAPDNLAARQLRRTELTAAAQEAQHPWL